MNTFTSGDLIPVIKRETKKNRDLILDMLVEFNKLLNTNLSEDEKKSIRSNINNKIENYKNL